MKVSKQKNYIILEDEKDDVNDFASFLGHIIPKEFSSENIVIDLLKYDNLTLEQLLGFLFISNKQRKKKKSFVIVNKSLDTYETPEELIVVPTKHEAEDVIELEEIERDLGF